MNFYRLVPGATLAALWLFPLKLAAEGVPLHSDRSREWIDLPWQIKYVLFVDTARIMNLRIASARRSNSAPDKPGRTKVYLDADEMLEPTAMFSVPDADPLALVLIKFDSTGRVTGKNTRLGSLRARRNLLDDLVLTKSNSKSERPYYFADWSQGIPGDESFSPAICATWDTDRYASNWDGNFYAGSFGCREWTAQLYFHEQPYIDVTSYAKVGNFIGEFVGWARFVDPPKPIIGLQGKTWLCLHDCPAGETPGVIPSITKWAAKHRFPVPTPPPRQPMYPNSNYKDDLGE